MESLLEFCNDDTEREIIEAYMKHGSDRKAANSLGCGKTRIGDVRRRIQNRAANKDFYNADDGYFIKGTSTLYDEDGNEKLRWVKTSIDDKTRYRMWEEVIHGLASTLPKADPVVSPVSVQEDLLVAYPVGDMHLGMFAWGEESGEDWSTQRGEEVLCRSMDHLLSTSVDAEKALIVLLGDYTDFDSLEPVTPKHHNVMDADSRYAEVVRVAIRSVRYLISKALEKHSEVTVICELGNHDPSSMIFLTETLAHVYEDEPRVVIDRSPAKFHYYRFGKVLIGSHHGDTVRKMDQLPLIMATDRAEDWGETEYRYWFTGHVHHQSVRDFPGCSVESFRILAPVNAYAHGAGYRSYSDMKSITFHRDYGEIARSIFTPKMLA